jgi:hexosaminidase
MRKLIVLFTGVICFQALLALNPTIDYRIIPLPKEICLQPNQQFVLGGRVLIHYPSGNQKMKANALFLSTYLNELTGKVMSVESKHTKGKAIFLSLGLQSSNPESYRLIVNSDKIVIQGVTAVGVFYGIQTLRKSIPFDSSTTLLLPGVIINDSPRFAYRGMHLDVARHFFSADEVKRYIDILVLHNLNTFHWHLSDDQGWRIEIKKYPKLTQIGSIRPETVIGHNTGKFDGIPYGGFYTQKQIRDVIAYATKRYINIIPEIDLPGHMLGALSAYPELGCTGGPYKLWCQWGVSEDVLCAGNDKTLTFIREVLTEIVNLFPSKFIHVGGDECPKTKWKNCPKCQARIQSLGLKSDDNHTAEARLQSYIMTYAEHILNEKGRQMIGWDEILEGGLAPNSTVMSWRGVDGGILAARLKHNVIMTPNSHLYFDYYQALPIDSEPPAIGGYTPLSKVYTFEPVSSVLTEEEQHYILGAQANIWTEYIPSFAQVEYMMLPRLAALCEVQWTQSSNKNFSDFLLRLPRMEDFYNHCGYNYSRKQQ